MLLFFSFLVFVFKRNAFVFCIFCPASFLLYLVTTCVSYGVNTKRLQLSKIAVCSVHIHLSSEFDPCTESFKGLADLIEKENGRHSWSSQGLNNSLGHDQHSFASHMPRPLQGSVPTASGPSQHSVPPGFSLNHIHNQQREHFQQQFYAGGQSSRLLRMPNVLADVTARNLVCALTC